MKLKIKKFIIFLFYVERKITLHIIIYNINIGNNIYIRVRIKRISAGRPNIIIVVKNHAADGYPSILYIIDRGKTYRECIIITYSQHIGTDIIYTYTPKYYIYIVTAAAGRFGDALKKHEKLLHFGRREDFFRPRPRPLAT